MDFINSFISNDLNRGQLSIRSYDRNQISNSGNSVKCRVPFDRITDNIQYLRLLGMVFNNTILVFQSNINNLVRIHEDGAASATFSVFITPGTYTEAELETHLKTQLDNASAASGNSWTYTVSIDPNTARMTISTGGGNFNLLWGTAQPNASYETGFTLSDTGLAGSHTSPRPVDLSGPKLLYVYILNNIANGGTVSGDSIPYHFIVEIKGGWKTVNFWTPQETNLNQLIFAANLTGGIGDLGVEIRTDRSSRNLDLPSSDYLLSDWIINLEVVNTGRNGPSIRY